MEDAPELQIDLAQLRTQLAHLRAGERVLLTGELYSVTEMAHQRLCALLDRGMPLPIPLEDAIFYYACPAPARADMATGACGPTTARAMDRFTVRLFEQGLAATIAKGDRNAAVEVAIRENAACHFSAVGGAGAMLAQSIVSMTPAAFPELGCEAIHRLVVKDFPVIVAIDCRGGNIYRGGKSIYRQI